MAVERRARGSFIGVVYLVLGALFLLDRLDVLHLRATYVPPFLLIGFGVAVVVGGRARRATTTDWD
jgi:hypothetical protein